MGTFWVDWPYGENPWQSGAGASAGRRHYMMAKKVALPETCGKGLLATCPETVPPEDTESSAVAEHFPDSCPTVALGLEIDLKIDQHWPMFSKV